MTALFTLSLDSLSLVFIMFIKQTHIHLYRTHSSHHYWSTPPLTPTIKSPYKTSFSTFLVPFVIIRRAFFIENKSTLKKLQKNKTQNFPSPSHSYFHRCAFPLRPGAFPPSRRPHLGLEKSLHELSRPWRSVLWVNGGPDVKSLVVVLLIEGVLHWLLARGSLSYPPSPVVYIYIY